MAGTRAELSRFVGWLTQTHAQRWHAHSHNVGTGHLYQGRFKSFPVQHDDHLYSVCRYVERNALRADLVERAEDWAWGSLWERMHGAGRARLLSPWPVPFPLDWVGQVTEAELQPIRRSVKRGQPYGEWGWVETTAKRLGLEQTLRPLGKKRGRGSNPSSSSLAPLLGRGFSETVWIE